MVRASGDRRIESGLGVTEIRKEVVNRWGCHAYAITPIPWRELSPPCEGGVRGGGPGTTNYRDSKGGFDQPTLVTSSIEGPLP
jgi:hypothetical protein